MQRVQVPILRFERFQATIDDDAYVALADAVENGRAALSGRRLWHVNSTASGGGVAEILRPLVGYQLGAGWDGGWIALNGDPEFFAVTKRLHNHLHGQDSGGELDGGERRTYERVSAAQLDQVRSTIRGGDVVVLHDPQTLGLAPGLADAGATLLWICHIGIDEPNDVARDAWAFLRGYLDPVEVCIFTRRSYAWSGIDPSRLRIVPPAIDPFAAKNQPLESDAVRDVLHAAGILDGPPGEDVSFERADGNRGVIRERVDLVEDGPVPPEAPTIVQVSRWDRLKDHAGVLDAFGRHLPLETEAHLLLVGPRVDSVADDPEQSQVLREVRAAREALPPPVRRRTHIVCMPGGDVEASHATVNALQRHADVIAQKSLAEGFGLTVAEAMWKSRAVVATRVGGIQDQIDHERTGLLIDDPRDLESFGAAVGGLLRDPARRDVLGRNAHEVVRERFLLSRYLGQIAEVVAEVAENDLGSEAV